MATLTMQRHLVAALKKETCLNLGILSKLQTVPLELPGLLKENSLEKLTQNLFNHLSHYLICIIDPQASASLSWPIYDIKTERAYRNDLYKFISDYSTKGLLSPVISSYLVSPGCFKVTMLIFQLSQLAVQKMVISKIKKEKHEKSRKLYSDMTEKSKSGEKEVFLAEVERYTETVLSKFYSYLYKRRCLEKIAEVFRKKISEMESKLIVLNPQKYLDDLVDGFLSKNITDAEPKVELLKIKNVNEPALFFDWWLLELDRNIEEIESKWIEKVSPFLTVTKDTQSSTESLLARRTGEVDKSMYMIEYNHRTDEIHTEELQEQVNSQQKYILKNIIKDKRLSFPNLIRGFLIAVGFLFKNMEIGDGVYEFNEYLEGNRKKSNEMVKTLRELIERVVNADAKIQPSPLTHHSLSINDFPEIRPLMDLSDLYSARKQCPVLFDSFTPISISKHQLNLRRKTRLHSFAEPQFKPFLFTPFYRRPKDDFMGSVISYGSSNDCPNTAQNFHDISVVSRSNYRPNETIAGCSSGFTKQQILRLLSSNTCSIAKKLKRKTDRTSIHIKKGALFNESNTFNESNGLFRSNSSPNLFGNREKRSLPRAGGRNLSIMQEDCCSVLEVSGIAALDKDSNCDTPEVASLENSRKQTDTTSLPLINIVQNINVDSNEEIPVADALKEKELERNTETPKATAQLICRTSSMEKIINRFKKVRANVLPSSNIESRTIVEEKENTNVNAFTANKILLPDLLSPSCSDLNKNCTDYLDEICMDEEQKVCKKARESLGTALGVDETFLDQFDLVDD